METLELDFKMVGLSPKRKARIVEAVYRSALLSLGKSPDSHVYSLEESFLKDNENTAAGAFLRKAKNLYESFDGYEQVLFLAEVLETGRFYPFWYLPFAAPREYGAQVGAMWQKVAEAF